MELFVVRFEGAVTVHAESEAAARQKMEQWATALIQGTPNLLMPESTAVLMNACEEPSHEEKRAKKEKIKAETAKKKKK